MNILSPHPISLIPPPLTLEEDSALEASLLKNGQVEDITVFEGMILNGNHRYRHLIKHGINPRIKEFIPNGVATAKDFVLAHLEGRNLKQGQRACIAALLTQIEKKNPLDNLKYSPNREVKETLTAKDKNYRDYKNRTSTKLSKSLGVGSNSTTKVAVLLKYNKELFNKVYSGVCSVQAAYAEHRRNIGAKTKPTDQTTVNLKSFKTQIKIPICFDSREVIESFIKTMNAHGWNLEMRFISGKILAHWFGNGYSSVGTNWSVIKPEFEFKRAVIVAANDKKDKLK